MGRGLSTAYRLVPLIVAAGEPDHAVADALGLTEDGVRAFRRTRRVPSRFRKPIRPAPPRDQLAGRTLTAITRAFRCRPDVARRWLAAYGLSPAHPVRRPSRPSTPAPRRRAVSPPQTPDEVAQAVRVLRSRFASVYRCDIRLFERSTETAGDRLGLPDRGRDWWWIEGVGAVDRETLVRMAQD